MDGPAGYILGPAGYMVDGPASYMLVPAGYMEGGPCNFSVSPWSKAFFFPFLGDFCSTWRSVGTLSGLSGPGLDKSCICVLKVTFKTKGQPAGTLTQPDRQTL